MDTATVGVLGFMVVTQWTNVYRCEEVVELNLHFGDLSLGFFFLFSPGLLPSKIQDFQTTRNQRDVAQKNLGY